MDCSRLGTRRLPEYGNLVPVHGTQNLFEAALSVAWLWEWDSEAHLQKYGPSNQTIQLIR